MSERRVRQVLRASVRDGAGPRADGAGVRGIATAAIFHGVAGYVLANVRDGLEAAEREALEGAVRRAVLTHLRVLSDLRFLQDTLDPLGIDWLVLKGPSLVAAHGGPTRRSYGDLDVLVRPTHLGDAMVALEAAGASMLDRNWSQIRRERKGEVHLRGPSGMLLDVHWHPINERRVRERFSIPVDDLLDRRRPIRLGELSVPVLDPVHELLYVTLHAVLSGAHRLIWLKDVHLLLRGAPAPASRIAETSRAWGTDLVVATALDRIEPMLGLPASGRWLSDRSPVSSRWRRVARTAFRAVPPERERGGISPARIVARSARSTAGESFRELRRRTSERLRDPLAAAASSRFDLADDDPRSDRYPSGGRLERDRFVAEVAGGRWSP
jgi:hypothetical protein